MKTIKILSVFTVLTMLSFVFTNCKKDPSATGVTMNKSTAYIGVGDTLQLTATVLPADLPNKEVTWKTSNWTVAKVNNGMVTALTNGTTTITVTTKNGKSANCFVTVNWLGKAGFRTSQTWTVSGKDYTQTWSDEVIACGCKKDDYRLRVRCRQNSGYGDLFSWEAVNQYAPQLCPEGWRVPTSDDFVNLDKALGGNGKLRYYDTAIMAKYLDTANGWGAVLGGKCNINGVVSGTGIYGHWWSSEEVTSNTAYAYSMYICPDNTNIVAPRYDLDKTDGYSLRCIKN